MRRRAASAGSVGGAERVEPGDERLLQRGERRGRLLRHQRQEPAERGHLQAQLESRAAGGGGAPPRRRASPAPNPGARRKGAFSVAWKP